MRRRFVDAVRVQPKGKRGKADEAVALIGKLYGIEREFKDASIEDRLSARQSRSAAVLTELQVWLQKTQPLVTPKSALGTALAYMGDLWSRLTVYTERGDLPIDNNRYEHLLIIARRGCSVTRCRGALQRGYLLFGADRQSQWAGALCLAVPGAA